MARPSSSGQPPPFASACAGAAPCGARVLRWRSSTPTPHRRLELHQPHRPRRARQSRRDRRLLYRSAALDLSGADGARRLAGGRLPGARPRARRARRLGDVERARLYDALGRIAGLVPAPQTPAIRPDRLAAGLRASRLCLSTPGLSAGLARDFGGCRMIDAPTGAANCTATAGGSHRAQAPALLSTAAHRQAEGNPPTAPLRHEPELHRQRRWSTIILHMAPVSHASGTGLNYLARATTSSCPPARSMGEIRR